MAGVFQVTFGEVFQLTMFRSKLELAIFFDDVLRYYLQKQGSEAPHIQRGQLNYRSEIYLAFTKANPQSSKRAEALDADITPLKKSGLYQQLLQQIRP